MLVQRSVQPESLPAAEDVNAVKKRLKTEDKKVLKEVKRGKGKKN
jgi:DNA-damage-inducible protein D